MDNESSLFGPDDHLVVVVAHPDDETFGCGSIIAAAVAAGARVSVVCATRGEAGEATEAVAARRCSLGQIRELELRSAAAILGAHQVELLDFVDSGFDGPVAARALCAAGTRPLARLVRSTFVRLGATVVVTLDGCDGHRDHQHLRDAVLAATDDLPCRVYLSTIPNSVMRLWLDDQRAAGHDSAYHAIDPATIGRPDQDVTTRLDVREHLAVRLRAIAAHASQRSPFDGLSEPLRDAFLCTDHLVEVTRVPSVP